MYETKTGQNVPKIWIHRALENWNVAITPAVIDLELQNFVDMVLGSIPIDPHQIWFNSKLRNKSSFFVHSGHFRNPGKLGSLKSNFFDAEAIYQPYLNKIDA